MEWSVISSDWILNTNQQYRDIFNGKNCQEISCGKQEIEIGKITRFAINIFTYVE